MRSTYFSEVRRDKSTGKLNFVAYQYEPPTSGEGRGRFFEVHFKPRIARQRLILVVGYLLAVGAVEFIMAEDSVRVGVGLLGVVIGAFLTIASTSQRVIIPGKQTSERQMSEQDGIVETVNVVELPSAIKLDEPSSAELLLFLLQSSRSREQAHYQTAGWLAQVSWALTLLGVTLSALTGTAALLSIHARGHTLLAITAGSALAVALVSLLVRALQLDRRAEHHRQTAAAWEDLSIRMKRLQTEYPTGVLPEEFLPEIVDSAERLSSRSPPIPKWLSRRSQTDSVGIWR